MNFLLALALSIGQLFSFLNPATYAPPVESPKTNIVSVNFGNVTIPAVAVQTPRFAIAAAASGLAWSATDTIVANHQILALYPLNGYTFPTLNGGSYTPTQTQINTCNQENINTGGGGTLQQCDLGDIVVTHTVGVIGGQITGFELCLPLFVSPNQINIALAYDTGANSTFFTMYKWSGNVTQSGIRTYSVTAADNYNGTIQQSFSNAQAFFNYTPQNGVSGAYVVGTLYGISDGTDGGVNGAPIALKSISDGNSNPRVYKGQATFLQTYYSGIRYDGFNTAPGGQIDKLRFVYDGQDGVPYTQVQANNIPYKQSDGVYVCNLFAPPAGWGNAGMHDIRVGIGTLVSFTQGSSNVLTGKIWWN